MESSPRELARRYVDASNQHDPDRIRTMFADDAVYVSSRVGAHEGAEAIIGMMVAFFARFPDVHWTVGEYRQDDAGAVVFDFIMTAAAGADDQAVEVRGVETIAFDAAGRIVRIDVSA